MRQAAAAVVVPGPQESEDPPFDASLAASYVGRSILVDLTYCDSRGAEVRRQQLHGTVRVASRAGIVIALAGARAGETWNMPPDLGGISWAAPGEYTLRSSDETVRNPDLVATWVITAPPARGAVDALQRLARGRTLLVTLAPVGVLAVGLSYASGLPLVVVALLLLAGLFVNGLVAVMEDDLPGGFHDPAGTDTPPWAAIAAAVVRWGSALALLTFAAALALGGLATAPRASVPIVFGMALACVALATAALVRRRWLIWLAVLCALGGTALMTALP